jgi:hypothetical protein
MAVQITTGSSSTGKANVTATFDLQVRTPTDEATAGFAQISSENDDGSATGTRSCLSPETDSDYRLRTATDSLWDSETFNYTAANTGKHITRLTTFTVSYASGFFTTNAASVTTASSSAMLATYRHFPVYGADQTYAEIAAGISAAMPSGTTIDLGFFTNSGSTPFAPNDGAYIRITNAGVTGVVNYNGSETSTAVFKTTDGVTNFAPAPNTTYHFVVSVNEREVEFWIDDTLRGTITIDATATGQPFIAGSLPFAVRHTISGAGAGGVVQLKLADYTISKGGYNPTRSWETTLAAAGYMGYQGQSGHTMGSTANYANSANPTAAVPTNTTAALGVGLGGQFWETDTLAATTDGIICSYLNPAATANITGRCLIVRGVKISSHVQTVLGAGAGYVASYSLAFGHTALSLATTEAATAKAPRRIALGFQTVPTTAAALTLLQTVEMRFDCPVVINPGEYIAVVKKKIGAAPASGTIAHLITFDCVFE